MLYRSLTAAALVLGFAAGASAQTKATFIFPAPPTAPAFVPHFLAQHKGYFKAEGLDVQFVAGQGGADAATQAGAGNADVAGGLGDTSMVVRANGVPIRTVALLGGGGLHQIFIREDAGIADIQQIRGKTIAVQSYQDTSYIALLGVLAKLGMTKNDVAAQAVGYAGVPQMVIANKAPVMAGVIDWAITVEDQGVKLKWLPIRDYFPSTAQGILASDKTIAEKPEVVRGIVKGVLRSLAEVMADPAKAAREYVAAVPAMAGREASMTRLLEGYNTYVYKGQAKLGAIDPAALTTLQDFYVKEGVIRRATPVNDLYTNQFVN